MQTPTNLNEQHIWGGQLPQSRPFSVSEDEGEQMTIVTHQLHAGHQDSQFCPSSPAGFVASNSDDLFNPTMGGPTLYAFNLPDVPFNPNPHYHAYNRRANTVPRPLPFSMSSSSYNNPSFAVPPPLSHVSNDAAPPFLITHLLIHWDHHPRFLLVFLLNQCTINSNRFFPHIISFIQLNYLHTISSIHFSYRIINRCQFLLLLQNLCLLYPTFLFLLRSLTSLLGTRGLLC